MLLSHRLRQRQSRIPHSASVPSRVHQSPNPSSSRRSPRYRSSSVPMRRHHLIARHQVLQHEVEPVALVLPPTKSVYLSPLRPTMPMSLWYGRAQPFGQPVMRTLSFSSARPSACSSASSSSMIAGQGALRLRRSPGRRSGSPGRPCCTCWTQRQRSPAAGRRGRPACCRSSGGRAGSMSHKQDVLQRRQADVGPNLARRSCAAPVRRRKLALVLDAAVLDARCREQLAVALRMPAEVQVEAGDRHVPRQAQRAGQ